MFRISTQVFRVVIAVSLISLAIYLGASHGLITFDPAVATARHWRYFGSIMPVWAIWAYAILYMTSLLAGLIGSIFFWWVSRWVLAASIVSATVARPFLGLYVVSAPEGFFVSLFGCCVLWIVVVSFFSPLATKFSRTNHTRAA